MSGVRKAVLCNVEGLTASLVHYKPGLRQPDHEHARTQLSFLILGDIRETVGGNETDVSLQASGVKPAGIRHAAAFGRHGALMLALDFAQDAPSGLNASKPCRWTPVSGAAKRLLHAAIQTPWDRQDILWDLAALSTAEPMAKRRVAGWLRRVQEHIADAPKQSDIAALAAHAGVHRVHLSRSFQAAFGLPPSLYRTRSMAAQALALMLKSREPLADIAAESGFADQSHFTRAIGQYAGLPPAHLRSLFANVTSVQDLDQLRA